MRFNSFQNSITFFSLGLLSVILISSLVAVSIVIKQNTESQIRDDLMVAKQVFSRLLNIQTQRMSENAYLLSSDFSFKQVIATRDQKSILSALNNLLTRINADSAVLVSLQQQVLADTNHPDKKGQFFVPELIDQAELQGTANSIVIIDSTPQQMVVTPIMAPDAIAWLCVSFKISQIQVDELMQLTQAHISLLLAQNNRPPTLITSSLTKASKKAFIRELVDFNWHREDNFSLLLENTQYVTSILNLSNSHDGTIIAVLQKSLEEELVPFYRLQWFLLSITLVSLSLAIVGSLLVARSVSRPVKALVNGVREVAKGHYNYRIEFDRSDEIGELGLAFNEMATSQMRQESLRLEKESAEYANQAKTDFLANMSHELRSPLNSILGYAQLLQKQNANDVQLTRALMTIEKSGTHLLGLINEILDLSKIEAGQLQLQASDYDLYELLENLSEIMQTRAESKKLKFSTEFYINRLVWINGDQQRLQQVLTNLLDNAYKYTESGHIIFKVTCRNKSNFRFCIEDTGIGIPEENLNDIFTSFHQLYLTHEYVEGTGLGLAISDQLVKLLGGELHVASTLGKGSQFWFELNLKEIEKLDNTREKSLAPVSNIIGNKQKILIADDESDNRDLLRDILSPLGFLLTEVTNGQDCLQQALSWKPDVILIDTRMPKMDGLEVCRQIRANEELKHIPIIAISANVLGKHRKQCIKAGADDFLDKPFQIETFLTLLAQYTELQTGSKKGYITSSMPENLIDTPKPHYPDEHYLQRLLVFAQQGDIQSIRQLNEEINLSEPDCKLFLQQLNALVNRFEIKKLRQLITHVLNETKKS